MNKRILCPHHKESTPSCVLYPMGFYHCFGCGAHGKFKDAELVEGEAPKPRYIENVRASIERIQSLPTKRIRGLTLHYDEGGYYVVWPTGDYYKYRRQGAQENSDKYRCPTGVPKPVFHLSTPGAYIKVAVLVEGELNALSIWEACKRFDVVCPGGAGDFISKNSLSWYSTYLKRAEKILLIVDNDKAGAIAAIKTKATLLSNTSNIPVALMSKDANEILEEKGPEALKQEIEKYLEVS